MADGDLKQAFFPYWFDFGRATAGAYRNDGGELVTAAIDAPRFDHDEAGTSLGLLVETGVELGQGDLVTLQAGVLDDAAGENVTVLHATYVDGAIVRRAIYSRQARASVNALLTGAAHHVSIAVIPGFLPNKAGAGEPGYVRYRGFSWMLASAVAITDTLLLGDSSERTVVDG